MKSITIYFLKFCLPILLIATACSSPAEEPTSDLNAVASFEKINFEGLQELISTSEKPYVLVNFYATWCKPCVVELPDLIELAGIQNGNIEVLLISLDDQKVVDSKLATFINKMGIDFKTWYMNDGEDEMIFHMYPDWEGGIPLNLLYNNKGALIEAMGMTDKDELEMIVNKLQKG